MSYEYLLVKAPAELARTTAADENMEAVLMAFAEAFSGEPIGSLEAVKAALQGLFPALRWQQLNLEMPRHLLVAELGDWSWNSASPGDAPEFALGADDDGQVRIISASRVERVELEQVARALGLMVLDEQTLEILTG
jgi:hypothetical protein